MRQGSLDPANTMLERRPNRRPRHASGTDFDPREAQLVGSHHDRCVGKIYYAFIGWTYPLMLDRPPPHHAVLS